MPCRQFECNNSLNTVPVVEVAIIFIFNPFRYFIHCTGIFHKLYAGLSALFDCGVKDIAVIHAPEGGFALDASGMFVTCPSFRLPEGYIVGKTGAGDAFCAGILYGISCGWNMEESLRFANGAAASSLRGSGGTETVGSRAEIESLMDELEVYSNHSE